MNDIYPDTLGDRWLFEIVFEESGAGYPIGRAEVATYHADELELVEVSGLEHGPEIELVLETSSADPAIVAAHLLRVAAEAFAVKAAAYAVTDEGVRLQLSPHGHPRPALRELMARLGLSWFTEDDGWYANVTWTGQQFPVAGVDEARLFLRRGAIHVSANGFQASPRNKRTVSTARWVAPGKQAVSPAALLGGSSHRSNPPPPLSPRSPAFGCAEAMTTSRGFAASGEPQRPTPAKPASAAK